MRNRSLKYTLLIAITGIVLTLFMAFLERKTFYLYSQDLQYVKLGDYVKSKVLQAQMSVDKYNGGNKTINIETNIIEPLQHAHDILQDVYAGKQTEVGTLSQSQSDETRALIKKSAFELTNLIEALTNAHVNGAMQEPDDSLNQVLLGSSDFAGFYSSLDGLIIHFNGIALQDRSYLQNLNLALLSVSIILFSLLGVVLHRVLNNAEKKIQENITHLAQQQKSVTSLSAFIEAISASNYAVDIDLEADESLRDKLVQMRNKLRTSAEDDYKRNWVNTGLAQIGDILRSTTTNVEDLYDSILKFVVKYTKSSQGGLFILDDETTTVKQLNLVACYAFERKKFLQRTVGLGEGLVGQCFQEGERLYLVEVPQEYMSITSGLGGSNPNALLIVPLKINDKIYGVLELATFSKYEDFEIELVEKLAESITSTISTVRVNESTKILLEKTQQQAEEMRSQEEEMRQNMEELEATQEEMRRKEGHIQNLLDTEKQRGGFNERSRNVTQALSKDREIRTGDWPKAVEKIAPAIASHLGITRASIWVYDEMHLKLICETLFDKTTGSFVDAPEISENEFPIYFKSICREQPIIINNLDSDSACGDYAFSVLIPAGIRSLFAVPFINEGKIAGIITAEHGTEHIWTDDEAEFLKTCADLVSITFNTSQNNLILKDLDEAQKMMQAIIDNLPRAIFWKDRELRLQGCNKIFAAVAGAASPSEIIGKTDYELPWKDHAEAYRKDDFAVIASKKARLDHEERNINSEGKESWVLTSKVPVMNAQGEVIAVLGMFEDVTARKITEADVQIKLQELEQLKKLLGTTKA